MKRFKKLMIVGMMALGALIGFQSNSNALTLGFYDGFGLYHIHDNLTPVNANDLPDANPLPGVVTYSGTLGDWIVNVTTGISKPVLGSADAPYIDLNSVNVSTNNLSSGEGLWIVLVDSGFTAPGPFTLAVGGTTDGSVTVKAFYNGNTENFSGTQITSLAFVDPADDAFSGTNSGSFSTTPSSPFSLGILGIIYHQGEGSSSFDARLTAVPEPSVILLMGIGLIGIWGFRKKFKK